jgi:hypothetical protein
MSKKIPLRGAVAWKTAAGPAVFDDETALTTIEGEDLRIIASPTDDLRAIEGVQAMIAGEGVRRKTAEALRDAEVAVTDQAVTEIASNINRLNQNLSDVRENLVDAGRRLLAIQDLAGQGGYKALFDAGVITIHPVTASHLRSIAHAVVGGKVPSDLVSMLPPNILGSYTIASLPSDEIETTMRELVARHVLPNAPQRRILAEVRRIRAEKSPQTISVALDAKIRERVRLLAAKDQIELNLAEIDRDIARMREAIGASHNDPDSILDRDRAAQ